MAPAVVDPLLVDAAVEHIFRLAVVHIQTGGGSELAAVGGGGGDGKTVHQCHCAELALPGLGAFPVGEVPGGVPDGELPVGGAVPGAEAGTAEALPNDGTGGHQVGDAAVFHQGAVGRQAAGIDAETEAAVAAAAAPENVRRAADAVKGAAGAAGDLTLIHPDAAVMVLAEKIHANTLQLPVGFFLHLMENIRRIGQQLVNGEDIGGMHGHGDGAFHGGKVNADAAVVIGHIGRGQRAVGLRPAVGFKIALGFIVGDPDGTPAGGLRGHHIDGVAILDGQVGNARAYKLHYLVFHIAIFIYAPHNGKGHVMGAYTGPGPAGQIDGHHLGAGKVIGAVHQLLGQLAAALANSHGAQGAVAGVGIAAQDHPAAAGHGLPVVGMDVAQVGGHINAAVFVSGGEGKLVVVLVDGTAYGAETVVAVGQHVGHGEFRHAGGPGGLDDAHIGDVMAGEGVKAQAQLLHICPLVVGLKNAVGNGALGGLLFGGDKAAFGPDFFFAAAQLRPSQQKHTAVIQFDHLSYSFPLLRLDSSAGAGSSAAASSWAAWDPRAAKRKRLRPSCVSAVNCRATNWLDWL